MKTKQNQQKLILQEILIPILKELKPYEYETSNPPQLLSQLTLVKLIILNYE
ncbi:MAG: hypothetical protein K1X33_02870 [Methanobacteriaceae archaeon]|nr:hypothetical protein [Methanobacteriaceae archaeon]